MTSARMPRLHEAQQLARLRALRVQRAREHIAPAQAAVDQAAQAVRERQQKIDHLRSRLAESREAVVTSLAPVLPRWSAVTGAHLERLVDQLERNEYGLTQDDRALEAAEEQLQQARSELTRALAREDAVQGLAREVKRARLLERDRVPGIDEHARRDVDRLLQARDDRDVVGIARDAARGEMACDLESQRRPAERIVMRGERVVRGQPLADSSSTEEGELALVSATPDQFKEITRIPALNAKTWNHPVIVRDVLLIRNGEEMAAYRLPLADGASTVH